MVELDIGYEGGCQDSQTQGLATYGVQVWQRDKCVVVEVLAVRCLDDFLPQFLLDVWVLGEERQCDRERIRSRVHGGEDECPARSAMLQNRKQNGERKDIAYATCPMSSSSGSLSSSDAATLARTIV